MTEIEEKSGVNDAETSTNASQNVSTKSAEKQEVKILEEIYPIQDFIENSKALGYSKEVVSGALFNCEKSELTKTEFEIMIKKFLGKKVK
jgi:hypothetical protein